MYGAAMEWLTYHHLRYFWAAAREGSVTRASEKLHISQPAVSTQIRGLEQALGEKLFTRSGRSVALTEARRGAGRPRPGGSGGSLRLTAWTWCWRTPPPGRR